MPTYSGMIGLQRILSMRCMQSIFNRNLPAPRAITIQRPLCSSTNNFDKKVTRRSATLREKESNSSQQKLIKKKFLAAASQITYHIAERSTPDPTEAQLLDLEAKLEYSFEERDLLRLALTHKSAAAPSSASLSWVGDSVLQLVITEQLAAAEGYAPAGRLTELRSLLASREHFAECALDIGLHHMLVAGKGMIVENEMNEIKFTTSVLGELFEAVLGAVFVDGGISSARHAYVKNFPLERELERMKKESPLPNSS